MKDLFIPYELAVIAKEKGFDEPCFAYYGKQDTMMGLLYSNLYNGNTLEGDNAAIATPNEKHLDVYAPLYQQIVDWFREKHNISIEIYHGKDENKLWWNVSIQNLNFISYEQVELNKEDIGADGYYEALNEAIEEAFKLI